MNVAVSFSIARLHFWGPSNGLVISSSPKTSPIDFAPSTTSSFERSSPKSRDTALKSPTPSENPITRPVLVKMKTSLIFLLHLGLLQTCLGKKCYYPGGEEAPGDLPCDTEAEHSPCCAGGKIAGACLANKLCLAKGNPDWYARGSCTDPTFEAPECPKFCLSESAIRRAKRALKRLSMLTRIFQATRAEGGIWIIALVRPVLRQLFAARVTPTVVQQAAWRSNRRLHTCGLYGTVQCRGTTS